MPVAFCSKCGKAISISNLPGGNPTVKMFPDFFVVGYGKCARCHGIFCKNCIEGEDNTCPQCGIAIAVQY